MLAILYDSWLVEVNNFKQFFSWNPDHSPDPRIFKYFKFVQSGRDDRRRKAVFNNSKRFRKCNSHGKAIPVTGRGGP
jgi:hypothetical protein